VFYDDGNDYLIVYRDGTFTITSLADRSIAPQVPLPPHNAPRASPSRLHSMRQTGSASAGRGVQAVDFLRRAPVLGVRFSLDKRHICIQRSHTDIDVVSLQDGAEISYSCKGKGQGNMLHGVVWTNDTLWDLVLVTMQGLELLKLADGGGSLKLVKHDRRAIHWHSYLHSNRLLALCSGKDYATVQCFQLMPDKLLKLPDFDPEMPPPPSGRRSRLDKASIVLCKLYDKLCCIHVNAARQEMVIYQLGRAAIGRLCTVNLFSASDRYALSVTDNLIAVHNTDARITMLFDAWLLQWSSHPVAAPLPLGGPPAPGAPDGELRDCVSAEPLIEDWTFEQACRPPEQSRDSAPRAQSRDHAPPCPPAAHPLAPLLRAAAGVLAGPQGWAHVAGRGLAAAPLRVDGRPPRARALLAPARQRRAAHAQDRRGGRHRARAAPDCGRHVPRPD